MKVKASVTVNPQTETFNATTIFTSNVLHKEKNREQRTTGHQIVLNLMLDMIFLMQ